jgi:putrescine transport system permease protein
MPITIFSRARLGLSPSVNTVATLTVLVVGIGVVIASLLIARSERRRAQEMTDAYKAGSRQN